MKPNTVSEPLKVAPLPEVLEAVKPLLDVPETADFLHLKESTVRSWILKKRLPHVKLGRKVFLRRCDLRDLITSSLVPAKA
jgi:excisionase family DNA binding protein